ncbi:hypothetical protein D3C72_1572480 [compost metagenome]
MFSFVFGDPSEDVSYFRHMTWRLAGLLDRQRRTPITAESRKKLVEENGILDALRREIEAHPLFASHTEKERKAITKKGDWAAGLQWQDLAARAGFHRQYFRNIYGYLCDYSHSSYAAALQVRDAQSWEEQHSLAAPFLQVMNMVMAHFISIYAALFESAAQILAESLVRATVERWCFTAADFDAIYPNAADQR